MRYNRYKEGSGVQICLYNLILKISNLLEMRRHWIYLLQR